MGDMPQHVQRLGGAFLLALQHKDEAHLARLHLAAVEELDTTTRVKLAAAFRGYVSPFDAGMCEAPSVAWDGSLDAARTWAKGAHPRYLKAVILCAFEAMDDAARDAFLKHVKAKHGG